jgi:hypothetical protein
MEFNVETIEKKLVISKLSKISFFLSVFSYVLFIFVEIYRVYFNGTAAIAPLMMFLFMVTSFVLSIIDLTRKDRKKTLSIIALILSSLYFLFFILAIVFVIIMSGTGSL